MKTTQILALAAILSTSLQAQHLPNEIPLMLIPEWSVAYFDLRGDVKECKLFLQDVLQQEWHFAQGKGLEKYLAYEGKNVVFSSKSYTYNAQNQPEKMDYVYKGEIAHFTLRFDKAGRVSEQERKGKGGQKTIWNYDEQGRLVGTAHYFNNQISSTDAFEYDAQGHLIRHTDFRCASTSNCDPSTDTEYIYGEHGLIQTKSFGAFSHDDELTYDAQGRLASVKSHVALSGVAYTVETEYSYDDQNRLRSSRMVNKGEISVTEYEYDAQGNWIKQQIWTIEGEQRHLESSVRREIAYF